MRATGLSRSRGLAGLALALAVWASAAPAAAQSGFEVRGVVVDSAGESVGGAMVVALALPDSMLTKWAQTRGDGGFALRLAPGAYLLQVTLIGHRTVRNPLTVTDADVDAGTIGLEVLAVDVEPLVVRVEHVPFLNRRDTLAYNARAFQVRPNATVEDLLRRLPGIEVDQDGTITAQGEAVQNVLVEGREFFGQDPTIATRNLPADAVERVEVYDRESDRAEFTGIPDGEEERTINLELREDARRGFFGDLYAGLGAEATAKGSIEVPGGASAASDSRVPYDGRFNLNRFSPTTQVALIGNASNVTQPGFRRGGGAFRGSGAGSGGGSQGLFENLSLGVNASRDFGSETWLRTSYFFGQSDNLRARTLEEERLLGSESASFVEGVSENESSNVSHRLNLNSQVRFADGHDLRIRGNVQAASADGSSYSLQTQTVGGEPLNQATTSLLSESDQLDLDGRLTWRKRLSESGRSLIAEARIDYGDSDRLAELTSEIEGTVPDPRFGRNIAQDQETTGRTLNHSVRLSFTEPLGDGNALELFGQRSAIDEDEAKTVFDLDEDAPIFNPILSSAFDRTYTYLRGGVRFSRNTDETRLVFGLEVQGSDLEGAILDPEVEADPISTGFTHLLPMAELRLQREEGRTFRLRYTTSTREPSMADLQPFADNDDPLNVYVGNPDLIPEYRHQLRAEYRLFDQFSFLNLFTHAGLTLTNDNIARARFVDEAGGQLTTPVNAGRAWSADGGVNFGTPIRALGLQVRLDYRVSYARETAFVNDVENQSRRLQNTFGVSLENRNTSRVEARVGAEIALSDVDYSLNEELNQSYLNPRLYADASLYAGPWELATRLNFQGYDEEVFGPDLEVTLWEAAMKRLIMGDRAEIEIGAYDLLNQNRGISVTNTASYNRTERVQSLGRHVMLRFRYRLGSGGGREGRGPGRGFRDRR